MDIPFKQAVHYTNAKVTPKGICLHIMAGSFDGSVAWFLNPSSAGSSNYLIAKDGRILQMVRDTDQMAWAQGVINDRGALAPIVNDTRDSSGKTINPNLYLLSIEFEGQPGESFTDAMYNVGAQLIKEKAAQYGFPIDRYHIIGHYQIDALNRPNDPGSGLDFDRIINLAKGTPMAQFDFKLEAKGADIFMVFASGTAFGQFKMIDNVTGEVTDEGNILQGGEHRVCPNYSKRWYRCEFAGLTKFIDMRDSVATPVETDKERADRLQVAVNDLTNQLKLKTDQVNDLKLSEVDLQGKNKDLELRLSVLSTENDNFQVKFNQQEEAKNNAEAHAQTVEAELNSLKTQYKDLWIKYEQSGQVAKISGNFLEFIKRIWASIKDRLTDGPVN